MAINYTVSYTFAPNTTISSSQVNTNFSDNANTWTGLEALTKTFAKLKVDVDPTTALEVATKQYVDHYSTYRRPNLVYSSATVVNIETGINGTSGQAQILFPDGSIRTDSTTTRINCNLAQVAALSGAAQSGLQTGTVSTKWYAIYAVKVSDSSTNFVTVADLTLPIQANFSTLNSNYGANSWVYLGLIHGGDGISGTSVASFVQTGNVTIFTNTNNGGSPGIAGSGLRFADTTATTLTYTYAAGTNTTQIPNNIGWVLWTTENAAVAGALIVQDAGGARGYFQQHANTAAGLRCHWSAATEGVKMSNGPAGSIAYDIILTGFIDNVLGVGSNPLL